MYQLGVVSVSFRGETPEAIIEATKAAGLSCIEWGSDVHAPWNDEERLRSIARLQEDSGIRCSSYGTYFRLGKDDPADFPGYIRAARILGTDILRLWCGIKSSRDYTPEELECLYADCRTVAAMAEEAGMTLCMECHKGSVTDWKEGALALMQAVDSPAFGMYWQSNHLWSLEENLAYAKLLAPWTRHLHVNYWDYTENGSMARCPLSRGGEIWKKYLSQFSGDRVLLLEFMPDGRLESLTAEAAALKVIAQ